MKRWIFLLIVLIVVFANRQIGHKPSVENKSKQKIDPKTQVVVPTTPFVTRKFPSVPALPVTRSPSSSFRTRSPQAIVKVNISEDAIRIGKSFKVVDGLVTIHTKDYKSELGKKISETEHYVFFQPASDKIEAWPVAQDSSTLRLYRSLISFMSKKLMRN